MTYLDQLSKLRQIHPYLSSVIYHLKPKKNGSVLNEMFPGTSDFVLGRKSAITWSLEGPGRPTDTTQHTWGTVWLHGD